MTQATLVSSDGVRIAAETVGDGPITFVFAHGITGGRHRTGVQLVAGWLAQHGRVVLFDQRGHGKSGGRSTLGFREPLDLDAAVAWARELSDAPVVTIGFSMGAAVAVRHAALASAPDRATARDADITVSHRPDATVIVSGVGEWFYRETQVMDRLHRITASWPGRVLFYLAERVRLSLRDWGTDPFAPEDSLPTSPVASAAMIAHPLLVVHGDEDHYFPPEHGERQYLAAVAAGNPAAEFWLEPGMGHAERGTSAELVARIDAWARAHVLR